MRRPYLPAVLTCLVLLPVSPATAQIAESGLDASSQSDAQTGSLDTGMTLADAVRQAEQSGPGIAISAEADSHRNAKIYQVRLLRPDHSEQEVFVDARTGSLSFRSQPD